MYLIQAQIFRLCLILLSSDTHDTFHTGSGGRVTMSQKITSAATKAGKPKTNRHQNRWAGIDLGIGRDDFGP
jgi:hypothetical protein